MGIDAARVFGVRDRTLTAQDVRQRVQPPQAAGMLCYVENIATDFYAAYHRYQPDGPPNQAFTQLQEAATRTPSDPALFRRVPSLSDPSALAAIRARLVRHVRLFGPYAPLYYNLGDETGIADLAAAWDFDRSPVALTAMRRWLRAEYGTLTALNAQWGSRFASWSAVMPMTTAAALADRSGNLSAWSDFKDWMDQAFADAIRSGRDAIHQADPHALAAIEGAQIPGWGGYDYSRLASAVDVMEIYDTGENVALAHAFNPGLITLTTTFPAAPNEAARLWRELLRGNRGLIVWDDPAVLLDQAGHFTALGRATAALFAEFQDGLAAQWDAAIPAPSPVALLYSPASFRIAWLLDRRADAVNWMTRSAEAENADSAFRRSQREAAAWLDHAGLPPRWITDASLAAGLPAGIKVLLLPHTIALSNREADAIRAFARRGGLILSDVTPGQYDIHGRQRPTPPLPQLIPRPWPADPPIAPPIHLSHPDGTPVSDIDIQVRRDGRVTLFALQRDPGPDAAAEDIVASFDGPVQLYDLRRHADLGYTRHIALHVFAAAPVILGAAPTPLPGIAVIAPRSAGAGTRINLRVGLTVASAADTQIMHVALLDPSGQIAASANLALHGGPAAWHVSLPNPALPGRWTIHVEDRLGSATATAPLTVTVGPG